MINEKMKVLKRYVQNDEISIVKSKIDAFIVFHSSTIFQELKKDFDIYN